MLDISNASSSGVELFLALRGIKSNQKERVNLSDLHSFMNVSALNCTLGLHDFDH